MSQLTLYIKFEYKICKIVFDELLYGEAKKNNGSMVSEKKKFLPTMAFSSLEELLPNSEFVRLPRSFIMNKNKSGHLEGNRWTK